MTIQRHRQHKKQSEDKKARIRGAIKNEQSRETGNIVHRKRKKKKQKHNIICVGYHHTQENTT
jgi:hypothetical protein